MDKKALAKLSKADLYDRAQKAGVEGRAGMSKEELAAALASGLLAVDLLHFVQSRVSMLDIFVPMFGVAGFLFLTYDRPAAGNEPA